MSKRKFNLLVGLIVGLKMLGAGIIASIVLIPLAIVAGILNNFIIYFPVQFILTGIVAHLIWKWD